MRILEIRNELDEINLLVSRIEVGAAVDVVAIERNLRRLHVALARLEAELSNIHVLGSRYERTSRWLHTVQCRLAAVWAQVQREKARRDQKTYQSYIAARDDDEADDDYEPDHEKRFCESDQEK